MKDHFRRLARFYDRFMGAPPTERLGELLDLPGEGALLEVGGGTGRVVGTLRGLIARIVVVDVSPAMLREAGSKGGLHPVRAAAERLPFPDRSFDRVLVVDALHHFRDQSAALAEMARVLRPGGRLVVEEADLRRFIVRVIALGERLLGMESIFHPPQRIQAMAESAGLDARVVSDGGFSAWVVAQRP